MSVKYQRVKQADLLLPTPLRWLTRAFSSITLAVVLLSCVVMYGLVGSVPIGFLAAGGLYALCGLAAVLPVIGFLVYRYRRVPSQDAPGWSLLDATLLACLLVLGAWLGYTGWTATRLWAAHHPWFKLHRATVIYRLPGLEMTELEFYSWWPLKLILGLFVVNMIWATIRRIEFKFVNIGVLSVHTGIVCIAVGSIIYGTNKIEGDMLLWRKDLGGQPVDHFYDQTTPAIYFTAGGQHLMLGLDDLPRYNDYSPAPQTADHDPIPHGSQPVPAEAASRRLEIRLHETEAFQDFFASLGIEVRATIPGFISYGSIQPAWIDTGRSPTAGTGDGSRPSPGRAANPALRLGFGPGDGDSPIEDLEKILVARWPAGRVIDEPQWALEYLAGPTRQRVDDLMARFDGPHGLIVEVPDAGFSRTLPIAAGQEYPLGDTGYTLKIEAIGPYEMSFASRGYEQASDTRVVVAVYRDNELLFRRIVMHRYPERSQDFTPAPNDPTVGPMGRRSDPDPRLRIVYIDATKPQYRVLSDPKLSEIKVLARLPDRPPVLTDLTGDRLPVTNATDRVMWVYLKQKLRQATRVPMPVITPKAQRDPKDEGTYLHALLPMDLEIAVPPGQGERPRAWRQRVWLTHMRYPDLPQEGYHPIRVQVPGVDLPGGLTLAFSRLRRPLPFQVALDGFEMIPVPGTDIPRDFVADLSLMPVGATARESSPPQHGQARLNNPLIHHGIKLSQTGWDPGDRRDPDHQAKDAQGRWVNQQRYSILGVGNNVGIRVIFAGACLVVAGIPWAFYIKPLLLRRRKRQLQARVSNPSHRHSQQAA